MKKLLWATYILALTPLIVGLIIFFSWWIGKAWFLVNLHNLKGNGFIWIFVSIPIATSGLITSIIYLFRASGKNSLVKGFGGLLCVLINIPALIWVLEMQSEIAKRAYVRIVNMADVDFSEVTIANSVSLAGFSALETYDSETVYFYPLYLNGDFDSVPLVDTARLVVRTPIDVRAIVVPEIYKGECIILSVNRDFDIETNHPRY